MFAACESPLASTRASLGTVAFLRGCGASQRSGVTEAHAARQQDQGFAGEPAGVRSPEATLDDARREPGPAEPSHSSPLHGARGGKHVRRVVLGSRLNKAQASKRIHALQARTAFGRRAS